MKKVTLLLLLLSFIIIPQIASAKPLKADISSIVTPQANLIDVIDYDRIKQHQVDGVWTDMSAPEPFYKTLNVVNGFKFVGFSYTYSDPFYEDLAWREYVRYCYRHYIYNTY